MKKKIIERLKKKIIKFDRGSSEEYCFTRAVCRRQRYVFFALSIFYKDPGRSFFIPEMSKFRLVSK